MTQPLTYPGVYVNQITPAPGPIQGVSTSTAAFVGITETGPTEIGADGKGPANHPDGVFVVTNFAAFKRLFGVDTKNGTPNDPGFLYLANAVFGFFNNGGTRAYVTRVAPGSAQPPNIKGEMKKAAGAYMPLSPATPMSTDQQDEVMSAIPQQALAALKSDLTSMSAIKALRSGVKATLEAALKSSEAVVLAVESTMKSATPAWSDQDCEGAALAMVQAAQGAVETARAGALAGVTLDSALARLLPFDDISIVAAPGLTASSQWLSLQAHCSTAAPNRFAVLDPPVGENWATDPRSPGLVALQASSSSAAYFPWIVVSDPITGAQAARPPSGHVAGVYARTDATRGVFKAPANEQMLGVLRLEHLITDSQQGTLNGDGTCVNCIRRLNGSILVWGARTAKWTGDQLEDAPFKYVSTRRTFDYIRASLESGTQWAVFEPNNKALWGKIVRNVTSFLTKLWQSGGLFGDTADQAFYVKCDEETNTPDTRAQGQVVTEIGVAITQPAEFVVFNLGVMTQGPS